MGLLTEAGNLFGGNASNKDDANRSKLVEMQKAAENYQAYRPELAQAHMNALSNRSQAYQGANNVLASMYGPGGSQAPSQMLHNPMSNTMMGLPAAGEPDPNNPGSPAGTFLGANIVDTPNLDSAVSNPEPYVNRPTKTFGGGGGGTHKSFGKK